MLKKICDYSDAFHEAVIPNAEDHPRRQLVAHTYFPSLCQLDSTCYGRAELSVCEQTNTIELLLCAEEFTISGKPAPVRTDFLNMLADADEMYLTCGDASFELRLLFCLSEPV